MATHLQGFQSIFSQFLGHFVLSKLGTNNIRVMYTSLLGRKIIWLIFLKWPF